ncbi:Hsp20/alpha crystallin family protein [Ferdinandcohnia quinoae]|uniref:Hsp20 family protein n=1 Tax=Fredinandcohnia quinoae TaxID=2918902 RepID=A0AAW5E271_9BACI|nr:Hsp20 family protein [Fredinandcohnia sp. SECRCQ15]MCH1625649.1 Hsp20 family protein [Fredinandcohnia sp. SECRCQ15]
MNNKEDSTPMPFDDIEGLEEWMKQFLDDPYTNWIDENQFRVDLFETQDEYIVEAELSGYQAQQIVITIINDTMNIQVKKINEPPQDEVISQRLVTLPFDLEKKKISALFRNEILEIFIKKKGKRKKKKNQVKIKIL